MTAHKKQNKWRSYDGFTIIELLVVVSIMVILGVIFTNILVDALRGRNKVKAINQVKQNGQVVLDKLSNEIRDADGVVCVDKFTGPGGNTGFSAVDTIVISNGGTYTQFRFIAPTATQNGKIQKQNFIRSDLTAGTQDSAFCRSVNMTNSDTNLIQSLTDIDTQNGVSINYTLIDATQPIGASNVYNIFEKISDNIMIKFNVSAGVLSGYAYDVTVAEGGIPFSTSVQVRGLIR